MSSRNNTWYCSKCNFDVFNSKSKCSKCLTEKPVNTKPINTELTDYQKIICDPAFVAEISKFHWDAIKDKEVDCPRCKRDGRMYNKDPMKSNHNCWKY
jgi:hypothetical protein